MGKKKKRGGGKKNAENIQENDNIEEQGDNMEENGEKDDVAKKEEDANPKFSVTDLMARVDEYLENFEHDMALMFCQKALDLEPDNVKVHESYGNVYAEIGDIENAKKRFNEAVRIQPETGHVKYLYLGQLTEGREAVQYYEKGVDLMKSELEFQKNNQNSEENLKVLTNSDVASVYCSLAELFMTDCCMADDAEEQCEKYSKLAVETDEKSLDAAVGMCNLLLNQCKMDDAKTAIEKAFDLWSNQSKEINEEAIPEAMSYEARVTLIKLLLEVECPDKVSVIVDQLIEENEDDIRICLLYTSPSPRDS